MFPHILYAKNVVQITLWCRAHSQISCTKTGVWVWIIHWCGSYGYFNGRLFAKWANSDYFNYRYAPNANANYQTFTFHMFRLFFTLDIVRGISLVVCWGCWCTTTSITVTINHGCTRRTLDRWRYACSLIVCVHEG